MGMSFSRSHIQELGLLCQPMVLKMRVNMCAGPLLEASFASLNMPETCVESSTLAINILLMLRMVLLKQAKRGSNLRGSRINMKTIWGSLAARWDFHKALIVAVRSLYRFLSLGMQISEPKVSLVREQSSAKMSFSCRGLGM